MLDDLPWDQFLGTLPMGDPSLGNLGMSQANAYV